MYLPLIVHLWNCFWCHYCLVVSMHRCLWPPLHLQKNILVTRCVVYIEWPERPKRIVAVSFIFAQCKYTLTLANISILLMFSKETLLVCKSQVMKSRKFWSERQQTSGCVHLAGAVINNFNSHICIARAPVYSICSTIVLLDTREKDWSHRW